MVCFRGIRIMVSILLDNLAHEGAFEAFIENYPDEGLDQIQAVLDFTQSALDARFAQRIAA